MLVLHNTSGDGEPCGETCTLSLVEWKHSHVNSQEWLLREVPKLIAVTQKVKPEQIIAAVKFKHRETVNYNAALQYRNTLAGNSALQFFYLTAYLDALRVHSPNCYMDLTTIYRIGNPQ